MNIFDPKNHIVLSHSSSNPTAADAARIEPTSPIATVAQGALATSPSLGASQSLENLEIYEGEFNELGFRHGLGTLKLANGDVYQGEFSEGQLTGKGTYRSANGNVYEGEFKGDKRHGQGTMKFANGVVYKGEFSEGKFHGKGTFNQVNGDVYEGQFSEDKPHSQGTYKFANGNVYEGQVSKGEFHGRGTLKFSNGLVYKGEFSKGTFHGKGTYTFTSMFVYEGEFKEGKFHGQGTLKLANGKVYEGEFKERKFHGKGKLTYANGRVYDGVFKEGKFFSKGKWIELPDPGKIEPKKQINAPTSASSSASPSKSEAPGVKQSPLKKEDPVKKVSQTSPPPQKAAVKSPESAQEPARKSARPVSVLSSANIAQGPFPSGVTESPAVKPMTQDERKKLLNASEGKVKTRGQAPDSTQKTHQSEPAARPASSSDSDEEMIVKVEDERDVKDFLNELEKRLPIFFKEERRDGSHRLLIYTVNEREFIIPLLKLHGSQEKFALGTGKNIGKALAKLQKAAEDYVETLQIIERNRKSDLREERSKPLTSQEIAQGAMGTRIPSGAAKAIKLVQKAKKVFSKK